jgi:hypothetical protein
LLHVLHRRECIAVIGLRCGYAIKGRCPRCCWS